jgi:hypothetical protein
MFYDQQLLTSVRTNAFKEVNYLQARLTMAEYARLKDQGEACAGTICKRFNGWRQAKRLAGLKEGA